MTDIGGSNGYRCRAWKSELQSQLADSLGLNLTVAHYPTGASKWNPIEHRLFSEISKNWAGEPLDSYQKVLNFLRLSVTAHLDRRNCPTGTEPTPEQLQALRLKPHEVQPKWNYTISPNLSSFCVSPKPLEHRLLICSACRGRLAAETEFVAAMRWAATQIGGKSRKENLAKDQGLHSGHFSLGRGVSAGTPTNPDGTSLSVTEPCRVLPYELAIANRRHG